MKSNVQKIRSAARHLLCVIEEMGFKPWCADDPLAIACDRLDAALVLPLCNADVGTEEEQDARFVTWRYSKPIRTELGLNALEWAQMPYEAYEEGAGK